MVLRISHWGGLGTALLTALIGACLCGCQGGNVASKDAGPATATSDSGKPSDSPVVAAKGSEAEPSKPKDDAPATSTAVPDPNMIHPGQDKLSPKKIQKVQQPGTSGWGKTAMKPKDLAAKIDQAFASLAGVENNAIAFYVLPTGSGRIKLDSMWKSPTVFSVQFPGMLEGHPTLQSVRSDGTRVGTLLGQIKGKSVTLGTDAWVNIHPLPKVTPADGKSLMQVWPTAMPKVAFGRFNAGKDVFSPLVSALLADPTIQVTCEERTKAYKTTLLTDYRILARRKSKAVATKGDLEYEIVVDSNHFVPVTMRSRYGPKGERVTEIDWSGEWKGGSFTDDKFALPKAGAPRPSAGAKAT